MISEINSMGDLKPLVEEIERVRKVKRDYVAPSELMWINPVTHDDAKDGYELMLGNWDDKETFGINEIAHGQIADRLQIPRKYYDRMKNEQPELLAHNINTWFQVKPEKRMIRTLDGNVRAYLSDRYRPLDNDIVGLSALRALFDMPDVQVKSAQLTDTRLYIQAVSLRVRGEVKVGDIVHGGIVISNSEIGLGSVRVEQLIYRLRCLNGMIYGDSLKKYHVGRRSVNGEDEQGMIPNYFADETVQADNEAFKLKVRDTVAGAFNEQRFATQVALMQDAGERKITGKTEKVIEKVSTRYGLSDAESESMLKNLFEGADLSQYGMANAVTAIANTSPSYDRAVELERIGGQVIELKPTEWSELN